MLECSSGKLIKTHSKVEISSVCVCVLAVGCLLWFVAAVVLSMCIALGVIFLPFFHYFASYNPSSGTWQKKNETGCQIQNSPSQLMKLDI